jgi:hypothetical protein
MGMAKRHMEEVEARGWADCDQHVCPACVVDDDLKVVVQAAAEVDTCDYCGESTPDTPLAASVNVLLDAVVQGLRTEYDDPVQGVAWDSREGGWQGVVPQDTDDLLQELEVCDYGDLLLDLTNAIQIEEWCARDPYGAAPHEALIWGWSGFKQHVKHRVRYMFLDKVQEPQWLGGGEIAPADMPAAVRVAVEDGGLARELPAGTAFWRCRPFDPAEPPSTAKEMGSPPDHLARVNRMTPAGVSAFYGASTKVGALAEVRAYAGDVELAIAQFVTAHDMVIIDLRQSPPVPSLFNAERRHLRPALRFLREFTADVRKPAHPDDKQHLEYVPTQVVAEYLRYRLGDERGPVLGVLWRSSVDDGVDDCVLFVDNDGCSEATADWADDNTLLLGMVPGSLEIVPYAG